MEETISIRAEFMYSYMAETGDGNGSEYKCPHGTLEKFLEAHSMKDIGVCPWHSGYRLAEKIFEIPVKGRLPPVRIDIQYMIYGRKDTACFDKKYNPVEITTKLPGGASPNENHYFLWIEERKEWICFPEETSCLWESGTFNQHITGPHSIDKSLEEHIHQVIKDAEQIERSFKFSFDTFHPHAISWLYTLLKERPHGINPSKDLVLTNEKGKTWEISSMSEASLYNFCKPRTEYTVSICGSMDELKHYCSLIEKTKDFAKFIDYANSMHASKNKSKK